MWAAAHNETETTAEETLTMTVVEWGTGAETIVEARSGDELGLTLAQALAPKKVGPTFLGELELDGSESFAANGVEDAARLVVQVRGVPPAEAVTQLKGDHGVDPILSTETRVYFYDKGFEAVPEEAWELVRCLPDLEWLSFWDCRNLRALPAGAPRIVTFFFGNHSASPAPLPRQTSQASRTSSASTSTAAPA